MQLSLPQTGQRERDKERERGGRYIKGERKREGERERERCRIWLLYFNLVRNDGCLGTF
jgi:hypothetical protein